MTIFKKILRFSLELFADVPSSEARRLAEQRTTNIYGPSQYEVRKAEADIARGTFIGETIAKFVPTKYIVIGLAVVFIGLVIL